MAASMDDLIATISGGMNVGQQANDLKELHAKLANTLQPTLQPYRAIPPTHNVTASDPSVPPAPVSSWNDGPAPAPVHLMSGSAWNSGLGNSPRQTMGSQAANNANGINNASTSPKPSQRQTGFAPQPSPQRPHHNAVLPNTASPVESAGFAGDAFRPLWERESKENWAGFANGR